MSVSCYRPGWLMAERPASAMGITRRGAGVPVAMAIASRRRRRPDGDGHRLRARRWLLCAMGSSSLNGIERFTRWALCLR